MTSTTHEPLEKQDVSPNRIVNDSEIFDSIWSALGWTQIRVRLPKCWNQILKSRYMLANIIYLWYSIGILFLNFHPIFDGSTKLIEIKSTDPLDQPVNINSHANRFYIFLALVHLISAFFYWWAWRDRSSLDIVMIPEYLNHIAAGLYLWSALWYSKQDTLGGFYTLAVHRIELTAAIIEVIAAFGWIMSWYMSYTRCLGRGFTFDDPDTTAYLTTVISSFIYLLYNIQINYAPEQYGNNLLYKYGDVLYFIGAWFYILAGLRDENCFWFLPVSGQYGIAIEQIQTRGKSLPQYGKSPVLITNICCARQRRQQQHFSYRNDLNVVNMNEGSC